VVLLLSPEFNQYLPFRHLLLANSESVMCPIC
jgi:hypothetical protein